jgi:hypothetical protein
MGCDARIYGEGRNVPRFPPGPDKDGFNNVERVSMKRSIRNDYLIFAAKIGNL